jgi:hypothetical protein
MRVVLVYAEDTNAADDLRHALRMLGGARPFKPVPPGENPATYTQERFSEEETDGEGVGLPQAGRFGVDRWLFGHRAMSHHACRKPTPHPPHRFRRFLWGMGAVYWTWCDGK